MAKDRFFSHKSTWNVWNPISHGFWVFFCRPARCSPMSKHITKHRRSYVLIVIWKVISHGKTHTSFHIFDVSTAINTIHLIHRHVWLSTREQHPPQLMISFINPITWKVCELIRFYAKASPKLPFVDADVFCLPCSLNSFPRRRYIRSLSIAGIPLYDFMIITRFFVLCQLPKQIVIDRVILRLNILKTCVFLEITRSCRNLRWSDSFTTHITGSSRLSRMCDMSAFMGCVSREAARCPNVAKQKFCLGAFEMEHKKRTTRTPTVLCVFTFWSRYGLRSNRKTNPILYALLDRIFVHLQSLHAPFNLLNRIGLIVNCDHNFLENWFSLVRRSCGVIFLLSFVARLKWLANEYYVESGPHSRISTFHPHVLG